MQLTLQSGKIEFIPHHPPQPLQSIIYPSSSTASTIYPTVLLAFTRNNIWKESLKNLVFSTKEIDNYVHFCHIIVQQIYQFLAESEPDQGQSRLQGLEPAPQHYGLSREHIKRFLLFPPSPLPPFSYCNSQACIMHKQLCYTMGTYTRKQTTGYVHCTYVYSCTLPSHRPFKVSVLLNSYYMYTVYIYALISVGDERHYYSFFIILHSQTLWIILRFILKGQSHEIKVCFFWSYYIEKVLLIFPRKGFS